jgi:hypothetical protein
VTAAGNRLGGAEKGQFHGSTSLKNIMGSQGKSFDFPLLSLLIIPHFPPLA